MMTMTAVELVLSLAAIAALVGMALFLRSERGKRFAKRFKDLDWDD